MRRLKVVGPVRGLSGYDHHTREFVRAMVRGGVDVELEQFFGWSRDAPAHMREAWFDRLARPVEARAVINFMMPNLVKPKPDLANVNYTMFEADRIPQDWADLARRIELTVLPTESSREAWLNSGVPEDRLAICPLAVDGARFAAATTPLTLDVAGRPVAGFQARFLNVTDLSPRKNYLGLIRAWLLATRAADDAVLILKNNAYDAAVWPTFQAELAALQGQVGRALSDCAPILLLGHRMAATQMTALYAAASHYISLSRGEGWDQPMMEAAASGLGLIAPRHSAYLSYLGAGDALWIDAPATPAIPDCRIRAGDGVWFEGANWWEPSQAAAIDIIRGVIDGAAPCPPPPRERIVRDYTWAKAAQRLVDLTPS